MGEVNLPKGWAITKLELLTTDISYGYTAPSSSDEVGPKLLRITDIQDNTVVWSDVPYCKIEEEKLEKYLLKKNDLVFARTGATVGKSFLIRTEPPKAVYASYLIRVRTASEELISLLSHFFNSQQYWQQITEFSSGIGQPNVNGTKLKELIIPLPPLAEQKIIADKLDILLAQVEATKARLERIPKILKTFRQSVLAAAVSGKLTEEWRVTNTKVLGEIKPLAFAGKVIAGQSPSKSEVNSEGKGEPYVTGPEQWDGRKILHHKWTEHPKRMAPEGSIFVTVKGAGVGTTFPGCYAAIGRDVYAFVPNENMNYTYILFAIQASAKDVVLKAKGLIPGLTKSDIVDHEVYLPSINEQTEIVHRVEELFAFSDSIEQKTNSALARVNNLTQSILAKAFRGELTTDWRAIHPDLISGENSAEALLKKIKIERETLKKQPRSLIVKKKKESSTIMANKLISVLEETRDWIAAQEAFRLCGVVDETPTERIEELYSELRDLDKAGRLQIDPVTDEQGRKLYDRLKLVGV